MNQQEIQLLLDLKIRGEQEIQSDFARLAADMAKVMDRAGQEMAANFAKHFSDALGPVLAQAANQVSSSNSNANIGGPRQGAPAFHDWGLLQGQNQPGKLPPAGGRQGPPGGSGMHGGGDNGGRGYFAGTQSAAGVELGNIAGGSQGRYLAEQSGKQSPDISAWGAFAKARNMAQAAGVKLDPLSEEEQGHIKGAIGRGKVDIATNVGEVIKLRDSIANLTAKIEVNDKELTRLSQTMEKGIALEEKQKPVVAERNANTAALEKALIDQKSLNLTIDRQQKDQALLNSQVTNPNLAMAGYMGTAATVLGIAGNAPLQMAQGAAAGRAMSNAQGRAFARGDLSSQMSAGELGGYGEVRNESIAETALGGAGAVVGAGAGVMAAGAMGITAATGGFAAPLAMGAMLLYQAANFRQNAAQRQKDLIESQSNLNEEQRGAESKLVEAASSSFGKARGYGVLQASDLVLGRGGGRSRAAAMGLSGDEYEDIAGRTARTMGVTAGGQVRAGQSEVDFGVRMASLGLGSANDLTGAMYAGGVRGQGQAQQDVGKILEDAVKAGVDQSALPGYLESIAASTSAAGLGGGSMASIIAERDLQAARGAQTEPEVKFAGQAAEAGEHFMQQKGNIFGYARVVDIEKKMKGLNPNFKGFSTFERSGIASGALTEESIMAAQSVQNTPGGFKEGAIGGLVREAQIGGKSYQESAKQFGIGKEQMEWLIGNGIESEMGRKFASYAERQTAIKDYLAGKVDQRITGPWAPGHEPKVPTHGAAAAGDVGAVVAATLGRDAVQVSTGFNSLASILPVLNAGLSKLATTLGEKIEPPRLSILTHTPEQVRADWIKKHPPGSAAAPH